MVFHLETNFPLSYTRKFFQVVGKKYPEEYKVAMHEEMKVEKKNGNNRQPQSSQFHVFIQFFPFHGFFLEKYFHFKLRVLL